MRERENEMRKKEELNLLANDAAVLQVCDKLDCQLPWKSSLPLKISELKAYILRNIRDLV